MLKKVSAHWLKITMGLDIGLTVVALLLARLLRGWYPGDTMLQEGLVLVPLEKPLYFSPALLIPMVVVTWIVVFSSLSIYNSNFALPQNAQAQPIFMAITGAVFVFAGLAYLFFKDLSRFLFLYFYLLDVVFLIGWRKIAFWLLTKDPVINLRPQHRVLIVGQGELADNVAAAIGKFAWSGLNFVGFVNDSPEAVGSPGSLNQLVTDLDINEVIFALSPEERHKLPAMVLQLQPQNVNLRWVPDVLDLVFIRATIEDFAGVPLIGLREPALSILDQFVKRSFDLIVASLLLGLTAPISLAIALLIKLDSAGPIIYRAQRVGEGGRIFTMYKFRTMIDGADLNETALFVKDSEQMGVNKTPDDPRITRMGRFLRRTSLDELPQLLNVLKGNMSLVGPRPELPWLVERYEPWQYQRFAVPQGMTGWWQIKNRGLQQVYNVRVEDDLYYIHNYSFFLDLRILWLTMGAIIRGDGAY